MQATDYAKKFLFCRTWARYFIKVPRYRYIIKIVPICKNKMYRGTLVGTFIFVIARCSCGCALAVIQYSKAVASDLRVSLISLTQRKACVSWAIEIRQDFSRSSKQRDNDVRSSFCNGVCQCCC